jgi:hypothetical protein
MYLMQGATHYKVEQKSEKVGRMGDLDVYTLMDYTSERFSGVAYLVYNNNDSEVLDDGQIEDFTRTQGLPVLHQIDAYHMGKNTRTRLIVIYKKQ